MPTANPKPRRIDSTLDRIKAQYVRMDDMRQPMQHYAIRKSGALAYAGVHDLRDTGRMHRRWLRWVREYCASQGRRRFPTRDMLDTLDTDPIVGFWQFDVRNPNRWRRWIPV